MAINEYMTEADYIDGLQSNIDAISNYNNLLESIRSGTDDDYEWSLYTKPASELTDQDRNIIDLNPTIWAARERVNNINKELKAVQKRNSDLKKEYTSFHKAQLGGEYPAGALEDPQAGAPVGTAVYPDGPSSSGTAGDEFDLLLGTGAGGAGAGATSGGAVAGADSGIDPMETELSSLLGLGADSTETFNKAIATAGKTIGPIEAQAKAQLEGAGIAAAKEGGYLKGLATRTGSSMGEAGLVADRTASKFRDEAAKIAAQKAAALQQAYGNISSVQSNAASLQAQKEADAAKR